MSRKTLRVPKLRHHKAKNLAVVTIDGKHVYLGPFGTEASERKYRQVISEWLASQARSKALPKPATTTNFWGVANLIESYLDVAKRYYVDSAGKQTSEYQCLVSAIKPLAELHGLTNAHEFGPLKLKEVRSLMVAWGWRRSVVNAAISRIRRIFEWAVSEELLSPTISHGLKSVKGLVQGRSDAPESDPVVPVAIEQVEATLPFLSPVVQGMVQVQLLAGMRPCEVVIMRPCDIDRSGPVWVYTPYKHKNSWRGSKYKRQIALGPKAQQVLQPFLDRPETAYLFSPREAADLRNAERRKRRKSPMTPSQAKRVPKSSPKRAKRERYDTNSYRRAIAYAIEAANKGKKLAGQPEIAGWYPLQLRHTRATEVRKQYGLEGAQMALGHENASTTEIYAEKNLELAVRIARETG